MTNKNKSQKNGKKKVNVDSYELVTNCDFKSIDIESLIRIIRGQKVMVDFDLAMLYGVKNKRLNEQVRRNIKRFPEDFMFQLTKEEWNTLRTQIMTTEQSGNKTITLLRSQIATAKDLSKIRTLPYAFTRNGIGMLSSVLGSDTAIDMNIRIMRVFTAAHQIMENNAILLKKGSSFRTTSVGNRRKDRSNYFKDGRAFSKDAVRADIPDRMRMGRMGVCFGFGA